MRVAMSMAFAVTVAADVYMHMPRGSNNRLNEKSANRNNGNRLFDSQNNNRGGYNVGDGTTTAQANSNNPPQDLFEPDVVNAGQYSELYYEGSTMRLEWTNQHGCGGNEETDQHKLHCNMVIQYTCNTKRPASGGPDQLDIIELSNGQNTNTPDEPNGFNDIANKRNQNDENTRGRHESEGWYYQCETRKRNKGLFTADQKLKGDTAKFTRQNPNGGRRGLECPEERDYFPYWHPTPWVDIAVSSTSAKQDCSGAEGWDYKGNSNNVKPYPKCSIDGSANNQEADAMTRAISEEECTTAGGNWLSYSHDVKPPDCYQAAWSRVNHLGNTDNGQTVGYEWTLPFVQHATGKNTISKYALTESSGTVAKCVVRLRYNMSTLDYDPHATNSSFNDKPGQPSPVTENPTVSVDAYQMQGLRLAINTAQFGRTFQDRSHTFYIKKRPKLGESQMPASAKVINLQVRGKRGNIVQTFPSVEYDFVPNQLKLSPGTYAHIQWTGSNTHNNGNPAGDGQAGDAGEGTGGTDRHNIAQLACPSTQYPLPFETAVQDLAHNAWDTTNGDFSCTNKLFDCLDCFLPDGMLAEGTGDIDSNYMKGSNAFTQVDSKQCAIYLMSGGFYKKEPTADDQTMQNLLNNVSPSLVGGVMVTPKATCKTGKKYWYMNTRNNNFSNRGQKGYIEVVPQDAQVGTAWQ